MKKYYFLGIFTIIYVCAMHDASPKYNLVSCTLDEKCEVGDTFIMHLEGFYRDVTVEQKFIGKVFNGSKGQLQETKKILVQISAYIPENDHKKIIQLVDLTELLKKREQ